MARILSPTVLSQSTLDVAFLIKFDRVAADYRLCRTRRRLLMAGANPLSDPIAIAEDLSLAPEYCRAPGYYLSTHENPHSRSSAISIIPRTVIFFLGAFIRKMRK